MNNLAKTLLLLGAVASLASCSDEEMATKRPVVTGEEITFGISAGTTTRTVYGDVNTAKDKIAINWEAGDQIEIACPEAAQAKKATYEVEEAITNGDFASNSGESTANTLKRLGNVGLQWSGAATHNFYATYPSQGKLNSIGAKMQVDENGTMQCFMPIEQNYKEATVNGNVTTLEPDMRYAFMVAKAAHTDRSNNQVALRFEPVVTALQFELGIQDINEGSTDVKEYKVTGVQLTTGTGGASIAGSFSYNFEDGKLSSTGGADFYNNIMMNFRDGGVSLDTKNSKKLNFTLFLLPVANLNSGNLKLDIFYETEDGSPRTKTATVNKDITARKKYFFKDMTMKVDINLKGSNWFSTLDENIYLNQLSIPVAGNVFSDLSSIGYYREQVSKYMTLWNQGVRGFELTTAFGASEDNASFGNLHFVCGEKIFDGKENVYGSAPNKIVSDKVDVAVKNLLSFKGESLFKDECLFLIFHFHPVRGGNSGDKYVKELISYLDGLIGYKPEGADAALTLNDFVVVNSTTTVKDLKGKIAIVIRASDHIYGGEVSLASLKGSNDWTNHVTLVKNWGSAYDRWDVRYTSGKGVGREATWSMDAKEGKTIVEDYLYGISSSSDSYTAVNSYDFKGFSSAGLTELTGTDCMKHETNVDGNVYVQEWARVVPTDDKYNGKLYTNNNISFLFYHRYLFVQWPSSIEQKKNQIKALLDKSTGTRGQNSGDLHINVLSGYYITDQHTAQGTTSTLLVRPDNIEHKVSITPFKQYFETDRNGNITPQGQGNGGNYAGLAADLNCYLYNYLTSPNYVPGPLGLIQLDYIHALASDFTTYSNGELFEHTAAEAEKASGELVELIWKNNFKFKKATKPDSGSGDQPSDPDSPQPISWKGEAADPSIPVK